MNSINVEETAPKGVLSRPVVRLQPGRQKRLRAGHPWVFSNEIDMTAEAKAIPPGTLVTLADGGGNPLAVASFSPRPLVSARVLDRDPGVAIDRAFLAGRIRAALDLRTRLFESPFYRLIWSEADRLPGLVVDRYGDALVAQFNTAGTDLLRDEILGALDDVLGPSVVVLRNDNTGRALEGLPEEIAVVRGVLDGPLELVENGARFLADPAGGQKTGWFFDHRENRARVASLANGMRVLDVYSYLGGFGIQAAVAGAKEVVCIDSSRGALELAQRAASLNGVEECCDFVRGEAFAELARRGEAGEKFDIVVADPPAFVKSKKDLRPGLKGYRKLLRGSAKLVAPGGLLFAASCSHHVDAAAFAELLRGVFRDSGRQGRVLYSGGAGPDHPIHPSLPESAYLKGALLQLD